MIIQVFSAFWAVAMFSILTETPKKFLPSVPGAGIYRTVYYLIQGDQALSTHYLISTLHTAGAIALAIFITDSVVNLVHLYHEGSHARRN